MSQERVGSGPTLNIDRTASSQLNKSKEHTDIHSNIRYAELFNKFWREVTPDNYLTLFGFRRYRSTHLLNLRFLEAEIATIDHDLYQTGLALDSSLIPRHALNRLGLRQVKRDTKQVEADVVDKALILRLRKLIKEYGENTSGKSLDSQLIDLDEALEAFNIVMSMETFSLVDNTNQSVSREDLHAYEKFKTRVDLPLRRSSRDPMQHFLRKGLRCVTISITWYK
ncbi:hypothetical protein MMC10_011398 [Thelotrema lepadinum]|nr:hypothetical protein [Thelotrema lepadinum]